MHPALRAILVPLLLLVPSGALLDGCSGDADMDGNGPTVTATAPDESSDTSTAADPLQSEDATDEPTTTSDLPDAVAAVCTPYAEMVTAIKDAASGSTDADAVAAEIAPVMKRFAAQVPDLERPSGIAPSTWQAVQALAAHILALPDRPTKAEIEAVEGQLSARERDGVEEAFTWLQTNCGL
jgi:hypothetical protein